MCSYAAVRVYGCTCTRTAAQLLYRAVYQFFAAFENNSNFGQKMFTSTEFRSKFVETYYLKFVKLEVARILGYIYTCVPLNLVPVIKYQYSTQS